MPAIWVPWRGNLSGSRRAVNVGRAWGNTPSRPAVEAGAQSSTWTAVPLGPKEKDGRSFCQKKGSRLCGLGAS